MDDFSWLLACALFFTYLFIDGLYALYTLMITKHQAARAASVGAVMYVFIAFGTISYIKSYWYVIPIAIGSWLGTFLTVRFQNSDE